MEKQERLATQWQKKIEGMFTGFDSIHERDGQYCMTALATIA